MFWDSLAYCHSTSASSSDKFGCPSYGLLSRIALVDKADMLLCKRCYMSRSARVAVVVVDGGWSTSMALRRV